MFFNRLMALLQKIDDSLIEGTAQARLHLYRGFGISPKLHVLVPFVAAWLSTLLLTIFCISEFWGQTPEMVILFGQVLILGVAGLAIYCLYKLEAPHHWEARDYKQSLAKAAKFRNKRDTRMALFLVLTSSAINIVIIKELSFTTMLFSFLLVMYLVWASAMVTVAYIVSAEPPPPESGDLKFLPQAA